MAENQNEDNKNQNDENDPYKFFKFAGPENNDDKDKKNKNNGKKKLPFWPVLLITLFAVAMVEFFIFPKSDDLIDYSTFKEKIQSGEIKSVVISDSYFIGYGSYVETEAGGKGLKIFNVPSSKSATQYKTSAVLTQSFLDFLEQNNIHYNLDLDLILQMLS
jgi:cell division protease FtsH